MPKKRLPENKKLPEGWRYKHNAYYYRVPTLCKDKWDGKTEYRLGKTLADAHRAWAAKMEVYKEIIDMKGLFDRYMLDVVPTKAPKTQKVNIMEMARLRGVFGDAPLLAIKPQMIYKYYDERKAKVRAKREIALLSHCFTKAVEWGYIEKHPFKGEVRLKGEKPRDRYIEDWEVEQCLSLQSERKKGSILMIQAYIRLKLLTGLRRGDLLRLKITDCKENGLHVTTQKTGKPIIYKWTDALREAIDNAKNTRPVDISAYIFCNKKGQPYINKDGEAEGWKSMWGRFMERVLKETKVSKRFTEHDLRAKVASDAESLERAKELLAHADSKITQKVYRRKVEIISPVS